MSLLRRTAKVSLEKSDQSAESGQVAGDPVDAAKPVGKGRPTPKRREAEKVRRGPVAPPPRTQREAVKRSKETGKALTKDERR
ncbi:DUF3043 domain-containing protein, partial [Nakamurella lactea]